MTPPKTSRSHGGGWPLAALLLVVLAVVILLNSRWRGEVPHGESGVTPGLGGGTGPTITLGMTLPGREVTPLTLRLGEGATLLEAMYQARQRDPVWDFATKGAQSDPLIVELAGQANGQPAGYYWTYDINGEPGQVGIAACQLAEGDDILWKFAPYE